MELWIIFPMLSMLFSGIFHTVVPASLAEARAPSVSTRHSRPKRCSCATFLDKECVYFCHLDIIWVNTPERTVSYGLGNGPRKKRSVTELARCECADTSDGTCVSFCHARNLLRHKAARDKVIPTAGGHDCAKKKCKHDLTVKTPGITRDLKRAEPSVPRATVQLLQLLLEKQRIRLSQRISQRLSQNTPTWRAETNASS